MAELNFAVMDTGFLRLVAVDQNPPYDRELRAAVLGGLAQQALSGSLEAISFFKDISSKEEVVGILRGIALNGRNPDSEAAWYVLKEVLSK